MRRIAVAMSWDMFARLSFLEGAAGVPAGSWLKQGAAGFGEAMTALPNALGDWIASGDQGLYRMAERAARSAIRFSRMMIEPEDLLHDLLVESSNSQGSPRKKLFYNTGAYFGKERVQSGLGPRSRDIQRVLFSRIRRATIDLTRKYRTRKEKLTELGTMNWRDRKFSRGKRFNIMLNLVQQPGGVGDRLRAIVREKIKSGLKAGRTRQVFLRFFDEIMKPEYRSFGKMEDPSSGKKSLARGFPSIRAELIAEGYSASHLSNLLGSGGSKFIAVLEKVGQDPEVKRLVQEIGEEADLVEPGFTLMSSKKDKALYLHLARLAANECRWRPHLRPLLRLATYKTAAASGTLELRSATMRTAFRTRDRELRAALVRAMIQRRGRFSSKFLDWTSDRTFKKRNSDDEVSFHRLSPGQQKDELKKWKLRQRAEREKLRPKGLCKETELTAERFNTLEPGALLWNPGNPRVYYKVTDKGGPQKGDAFVQLVEVCRDDPKNSSGFGESRTLHRSTIDGIGVHIVPVEDNKQEAVITPSKRLLELALPENIEDSEDRSVIETMTCDEAEEMLHSLDRILAKPQGKESKEAIQAGYTLEGLKALRDELAGLLAS